MRENRIVYIIMLNHNLLNLIHNYTHIRARRGHYSLKYKGPTSAPKMKLEGSNYPCLANACRRTPFPVPISKTLHPASSQDIRDSENISRSVIDNKEKPSKLSAQRPAATLAHIFEVHAAMVSMTTSPNLQIIY